MANLLDRSQKQEGLRVEVILSQIRDMIQARAKSKQAWHDALGAFPWPSAAVTSFDDDAMRRFQDRYEGLDYVLHAFAYLYLN